MTDELSAVNALWNLIYLAPKYLETFLILFLACSSWGLNVKKCCFIIEKIFRHPFDLKAYFYTLI